MLSYVFAFVFGLLVPPVASRYPKVFASDWGENSASFCVNTPMIRILFEQIRKKT